MIIKNNLSTKLYEYDNDVPISIYTLPNKYITILPIVKTILVYNNVLLKIKEKYIFAEMALVDFVSNEDEPKIIIENHIDINDLRENKNFIGKMENLLANEKKLKSKFKNLDLSVQAGRVELETIFLVSEANKEKLLLMAWKKLQKEHKHEN